MIRRQNAANAVPAMALQVGDDLAARERVRDHRHVLQVECIEHRRQIVCQRVEVVWGVVPLAVPHLAS